MAGKNNREFQKHNVLKPSTNILHDIMYAAQ